MRQRLFNKDKYLINKILIYLINKILCTISPEKSLSMLIQRNKTYGQCIINKIASKTFSPGSLDMELIR